MTTPVERHVQAHDQAEFNLRLEAFALECYARAGIGLIVIQDGDFLTPSDGGVEATLQYVPFEADHPLIPPEAAELLNEYDPSRQLVLAVLGDNGHALCVLMELSDRCTPTDGRQDRPAAWRPGAVLQLSEPLDAHPAGLYVYLRSEGARMLLAKVTMQEDEGDLLAGDEELAIHVDFAELFTDTGIVIRRE